MKTHMVQGGKRKGGGGNHEMQANGVKAGEGGRGDLPY